MQESPLCLMDASDAALVERVNTSNRLYHLQQELGRELVDEIDHIHEDYWARVGSAECRGVLVGAAIGGSALGGIIYRDERINRRDFFTSTGQAFLWGLFGSFPGAFGGGLTGRVMAEAHHNLETKMAKVTLKHLGKTQQISQYVELRHPPRYIYL